MEKRVLEKSTFIELLLGLLKPTTGSIEADNNDVNLNFLKSGVNILGIFLKR